MEFSDKELEIIENWDVRDSLSLLSHLEKVWTFKNYFRKSWSKSDFGEHMIVYKISTAGWSQNEELISALKRNYVFWSMFWYSSVRGGHFTFHIIPEQLGYLKVSDFCNKNDISRQAVSQNKHLYDWIEKSKNVKYIKRIKK